MADRDAEWLFRSWLDEHGGAVLRVARAYAASAEDRHDLIQEILMQVWRSLPEFEGRSSPATWAYRVALNTALGWHRRERRRRSRQRPIREVDDPPDLGPDAAEAAARRERVARLSAAIRRLPPADAALVLLHLDGLNHRQMAEVLGISENHLGVKLFRARRALGDLLGGEMP